MDCGNHLGWGRAVSRDKNYNMSSAPATAYRGRNLSISYFISARSPARKELRQSSSASSLETQYRSRVDASINISDMFRSWAFRGSTALLPLLESEVCTLRRAYAWIYLTAILGASSVPIAASKNHIYTCSRVRYVGAIANSWCGEIKSMDISNVIVRVYNVTAEKLSTELSPAMLPLEHNSPLFMH